MASETEYTLYGQIYIGRKTWWTGWGQVSGELNEQQKIGWCIKYPPRQQRPETDYRKEEEITGFRNKINKRTTTTMFNQLCITFESREIAYQIQHGEQA